MAETERILIKTLEQKVLGFIDRYKLIAQGDRLLVALSGGPDSVFVLYFLNKYKSRLKVSLAAAHLNHCLRGEDSDKDEDFCKKLAENLEIMFFSSKADVRNFAKENRLSIEEAARDLRYKFLGDTAREHNLNKIVTAHNMSDNAETVLLNLVKGTGLKGVSGIPVIRENIIRPVLALSKPEILDYLNHCRIPFRIDETNSSNDYERNYIRNVLLPEIKSNLNPSVELSIFNSSENFRNIWSFINFQTEAIIGEIAEFSEGRVDIDLEKLKQPDAVILGGILKRAIEKQFNIEFGFKDYLKIKSLLDKQTGRKVLLADGVTAFRERNSLSVLKDPELKFSPVTIRIGETKSLSGKKFSIKEKKEPYKISGSSRFHEIIAADGLAEEFVLRCWKPGDKFIPLGMKGYKKISDFLGEQKIPAVEKKKQLVLTNRDEIVWIPGFRIDNRYRITEKSKRILELCLE